MEKFFLSIDNGGTNTKVTIFNELGKQISTSAFPTLWIEEQPGFREIDLNKLWTSICLAIKEALKLANLTGTDIAALTCVGHGKGLYVLDKQKQIFQHGILSTDQRGIDLAATFEKESESIRAISQQPIVPSQSPILLRWLKENKPTIYQNIGSILSAKDFVRFMLSGKINQELGDASGNHLLHLKEKKYAPELLDFFGIPEMAAALPELVDSLDSVGTVTEKAASETNLVVGTPVIAGLFDIHACALASGVLTEDYFSLIAGTWSINCYPSTTAGSKKSQLMNSLYLNDHYLIEASSPTSAGNLDSILQILMADEKKNADKSGKTIYPILDTFLEQTNAHFSLILFFPFLYGSNVTSAAKASFIGLTNTTTKSEMLRAVYEGIAFSHRQHIEELIAELGHAPEVIRISGGAAHSRQWVQLFANVLGMPIETLDSTELGGLGGAILSAVSTHTYNTIEEAVGKMVHVNERFEVNQEEALCYTKKFNTYQTFLQHLEPAWRSLAQMRQEMEQP